MALSRRDVLASAFLGSAALLGSHPAQAQAMKRMGTVGMVKARRRPGSLDEIHQFLPEGVGMIAVYLGVSVGTRDELAAMIPRYEQKVALLAAQACDVMSLHAAPVFMFAGLDRETELVDAWQKRYKIPMFTAPQSQVNALRAVGAKSFVGATYFPDSMNSTYGKYFQDAGFSVLSMQGVSDVPFDQVQNLPGERIAAYIKENVKKHPKADAIYMLGSGWHVSDIIDPLEKELGIPVVHPVAARAWEIQKRLHLHVPIPGYGRLLAELP
jgi:maleate isomerase